MISKEELKEARIFAERLHINSAYGLDYMLGEAAAWVNRLLDELEDEDAED